MKYTHEIVGTHGGALLPERAPGACSGSKIPRVYRPLAPKFPHLSCMSFIKHAIKYFHVIVVQRWQRLYKKAWGTCKIRVLLIKPIAFLTFSLPLPPINITFHYGSSTIMALMNYVNIHHFWHNMLFLQEGFGQIQVSCYFPTLAVSVNRKFTENYFLVNDYVMNYSSLKLNSFMSTSTM